MSESISVKFLVQIRIYTPKYNNHKEIPGLGEPRIFSIFETQNKDDAYQFFESLKSKTNAIHKNIRHCHLPYECLIDCYDFQVKPFFEARILKYKTKENQTKEIELVEWTWILKRFIDISYHCKVMINKNIAFSKRIYHVPPILFDSNSFPADIKSRESTAYACEILRKFLPFDSFKLKKITALEQIDVL